MIFDLGKLELHTNRNRDEAYITLDGKRITKDGDVFWAEAEDYIEVMIYTLYDHPLTLLGIAKKKRPGT